MGQITSGTGLVSGLPIADIIDQLMSLEERPKTLITNRNTVLQSTQAAFQAINAQLLGLKGSASSLTDEQAFDATQAFSSNESVITASSGTGATPGSYTFRVKQLVSSQQTLTRGFADTDSTFVGAGTMTFDRGLSRIASITQLNDLNGGEGVNRGYVRITDRSGNTGIVDLRNAVTVDDVVDEINTNLDVSVIASISGDGITLTDNTGLTVGDLTVVDVGLAQTATGLGIVGTSATGSIVGTAINTVGEDTLLAKINDGNGVRTAGGLADFEISDGGGRTFSVNLDGQATLGEVIDAINDASEAAGSTVVALTEPGATGLTLTDSSGGGGGFAVTAINDSLAAADLGILQNDGDGNGAITGGRLVAGINSKLIRYLNGGGGFGEVTGLGPSTLTPGTLVDDFFNGAGITTNGIPLNEVRIDTKAGASYFIDFDSAPTASTQGLIDHIAAETGGDVTVSINGSNQLVFTDNTGGTGNFRIRDPGGGPPAIDELGINQNVITGNTITSIDLNPTPQPLTSTGAGSIRVTNRDGATTDIDLSTAESFADLVEGINAAGAGITASLNAAGNGLQLTDTTGGSGDITISDLDGATAVGLGIAGTFTEDEVNGGDLDYQYVTGARRIDDLGITRGQFRITDSSGRVAEVDLTQGNEVTIDDVLAEINSRGLDVNARLNDSGDGILLEDIGPGIAKIKVEELGSSTAGDLGILGEAEDFGLDLVGTFEKSIEITDTDTLTTVAQKINDAGVGVSASIINDGSPGTPFRLSLSSETAGTGGAFVFDDGGLGFDAFNLGEAEDAVVFFGGGDPEDALVITSKSNTLNSLIPGATINLNAVSDDPVQVSINRDEAAITEGVQGFVDSFNGLISTIDQFDSYDAEAEERGLLLGDSTVGSVRQAVFNAVIRANPELTGQYRSLSQIGITVGSGSRLQFDQDKFNLALENDREAVEELFTLRLTEEDAEGEEVVVASGIGIKLNELLDRLTDAENGPIQSRVDGIDRQLELNNRRIDDLDLRLEAKRARLEAQFAGLESVLAGLQDQSAALASLQSINPISNV